MVAGESGNDGQGFVGTLVNGSVGALSDGAWHRYLYGVGCALDGDCLLTGASKPGQPATATASPFPTQRSVGAVTQLPATNGLGQTRCGVGIGDCTTVGSTTS